MPTENNYSVLDKQSLAIYWSVKKLYQYLMGQDFVIQTDPRPLISILGEKKVYHKCQHPVCKDGQCSSQAFLTN